MNMAKIPSGHFPNGKDVQWKMVSTYVGWPLLEFYKGDPAGKYKRQKKTK